MSIAHVPRGSVLRIVVLGYIVRGPLGGLAWHHLQYVMGLAQLGHDVYFLEDSDDYPSCYDPARGVTDSDPTYGLEFAGKLFERTGLGGRWAYFDAHRGVWAGSCASTIVDICASADLLLNISGVNPLRPWTAGIPVRALLDTDPVFTQVRHLTDPVANAIAGRHTAFFTFGENFGRPGCTIPDDGYAWRPSRQPVVLNAWATTPGPREAPFTTVMQWDSYRACDYGGVHYDMKSASFDAFVDLPARVGRVLEVALGGVTAPRARLASHGWRLRDPLEPTRDPWTYQDYIRASKAEFSVAKHGYVVSRSGWFSERSAVYLASGRPVVTQDTGFSDWLPTGDGVLAFSDAGQACAAIAEVTDNYEHHCRAAREIVEEHFDSRKVLRQLIECCLNNDRAEKGSG